MITARRVMASLSLLFLPVALVAACSAASPDPAAPPIAGAVDAVAPPRKPLAVSPTVGYPSAAAQSLGTSDVSQFACPTGGTTCNNITPRFNWVLAVAAQESQAGWQASSNWPRSTAELSTSQLKVGYLLALQWNAARGEWVMDATSSVVPPAGKTIGFVSGCDNKPGFCTRKNATDAAATAMAAAAYKGWDNAVTGQCSPGYWASNSNFVFTYTNLGNAVAPYSTPAKNNAGTQVNFFNPDVTCKTLNGMTTAPDGCACRNAQGQPSTDLAVTITNNAGQPCAWSTPDNNVSPSLNNSGQTPHYLLPVYYDAWGDPIAGAQTTAPELASLFTGAGDWQTKFAPASMNNASTQGLGPPAMMFVLSVVGPASRFAFYAMNQVILNRGADGEGQCDPATTGGNCWQNGAGEYDFLEAPFWGLGQTFLSTAFAACNNPSYYIYDNGLSMDRLYTTSFNSSGKCNPMGTGGLSTGGAGSSAFFQTSGMAVDKSKPIAQSTWIYVFVVDASGIQGFRFRGDQAPSAWANMPVSSADVLSRKGTSISWWNGTTVAPATPPPAAQRIGKTPVSPMGPSGWTPAWNAGGAQPAGLYMPAGSGGVNGVNWWGSYSSVLQKPDSSFVPGRDTTLNYCVNQAAKATCGSACSIQPGSPLQAMSDPSCTTNGGGVGCNWGGVNNCRLCMPAGCSQTGNPTQYAVCPSGP